MDCRFADLIDNVPISWRINLLSAGYGALLARDLKAEGSSMVL